MKILVRVPNWLGDTVLALPALRAVAKHFSPADIWVASSQRTSELLASEPSVAGVLEIPEAMGVKEIWRTARRWRALHFDLTLLFTNSFGSALLAFLAGIPERWGYATDGRSLLLTKRIGVGSREKAENGSEGQKEKAAHSEAYQMPWEKPVEHQTLYYLRLLEGLGIKTPESPQISLVLTAAEKEAARRQLATAGMDLESLAAEAKPLVLLNPGASYGPAKRWPASRFGQVAAALERQKGALAAIIGTVDEIPLAQEVAAAALEYGSRRQPLILSGQTTLRELTGIISLADLLITNDTGPMHLANALGVPVVAIFGPTDPRRTRPWHQPALVLHKKVVCWPCWYRQCPYDHRCLRAIAVEEVTQASLALLTECKKGRSRPE